MAIEGKYGKWINFWTFQLGGWGAYFLFTTLGSIETFQSVGKAVLINGIFSSYGFITTSAVRKLFNSSGLKNKPIYYYVFSGIFISLLLCSLIVVVINLILLSFRGISIDGASLEQLFEGTFKFLFVFLGWTGIYLGGKFWGELQFEREKLLKAKTANKEMQLQVLKSQLNPHFLFNTMNSISALISLDPLKAELVVDKFSELLRISLSADQFEWITLREEMELIRNYLLIEQIRFEEKLQYEINLEEKIREVKIPTFLFFPLVENAVKYGIKTSPYPLQIWLVVRSLDEFIHLQCVNTGKWLGSSDEHGKGLGIGLQNVKNRLDIAFANNQAFSIREENQKVIAEIKFPHNESV